MPGTKEGALRGWLKRKKAAQKKAQMKTVTMKKGQTLASISEKHGVSVKKLIAENGIKSKDQIKSGLEVRIPTGA